MITVRRADERGHTKLDWLDSFHTFSFADYHDPDFMGFGPLRVINDDTVAPGAGFETHGHRDMEILSYILAGALRHKDNAGHEVTTRAGEVQRMTAGSGIRHSEFNASDDDPLHFLQIWIEPNEKGLDPGYDQRSFSQDEKLGKLKLIVSPDGEDGSVSIHQDARIYASILEPNALVSHPVEEGRRYWLHVCRGRLDANGTELSAGDGAAVEAQSTIDIAGLERAELLLFDVA